MKIIVECPHCEKLQTTTDEEYAELSQYGKVVRECECGKLFTIKQDDEVYYTV